MLGSPMRVWLELSATKSDLWPDARSGATRIMWRFSAVRKNQTAQQHADGHQRKIKRYCAVKEDAKKLFETAINKLGLNATVYSLVLKVAAPSPIQPVRKISNRLI
jgi:predicted ATPase with chaperone activity